MTDNKIFENEIKCIKRRANNECNGGSDCCNCDLLMNEQDIISAYERAKQFNDLINRQKAEIERFEKIETAVNGFWDGIQKIATFKNKRKPTLEELLEYMENLKDEAIKEFAERLKTEKFNHKNFGELVCVEDIDNLIKEMVGEG